MLTAEQFLERFPEFAAGAEVTAAVAQAALRTDANVFGTLTDEAHGWLTAHLLAASPRGKETRIKGEAFQTLYLAERQRLESLVGSQQIPPV